MADAIQADHLVYVFGPTHAGILAQELFYRAGGLVPVNPHPAARADHRCAPGHPDQPAGAPARFWRADHGRNAHRSGGRADRAFRLRAQCRGGGGRPGGASARRFRDRRSPRWQYSRAVQPRQPGMPRLFEVADLVLDDRAPVGDALVELPGLSQQVGPSPP